MKRAFIKRCQGTSQIGCAMKTMALALCAEALRRMVLAIVSSCNLHNSSSISETSVFSVVKKSTSQVEKFGNEAFLSAPFPNNG